MVAYLSAGNRGRPGSGAFADHPPGHRFRRDLAGRLAVAGQPLTHLLASPHGRSPSGSGLFFVLPKKATRRISTRPKQLFRPLKKRHGFHGFHGFRCLGHARIEAQPPRRRRRMPPGACNNRRIRVMIKKESVESVKSVAFLLSGDVPNFHSAGVWTSSRSGISGCLLFVGLPDAYVIVY